MKIYIVTGSTGRYDEYRTWVTCKAFKSKTEALTQAKMLEENVNKITQSAEFEKETNALEDGPAHKEIERLDPSSEICFGWEKVSYSFDVVELDD